jgi:hypothetical protein
MTPPATRPAVKAHVSSRDHPARAILGFVDRLDGHAAVLESALHWWAARDDAKPQPEARRAANTAMGEIDAMLAELHAVRARLVAEIRASDDASGARVDAMLADPDGWAFR